MENNRATNCTGNRASCHCLVFRALIYLSDYLCSNLIQGSNPRRFIIFSKNGGDLCANGRVGQAHTDLFVPSTIHLDLSYHYTLSKTPSERTQRRSSQRERMRAGYA